MEKVIVGLSGGVDSAAAAYLLKEQGFEVTGASVRMWSDPWYGTHCTEPEAGLRDAAGVAEALDIPYLEIDGRKRFYEKVILPFRDEYAAGRTPNPCVLCNPRVKWGALLQAADEIGAKHIATGHYAHIVRTEDGRFSIAAADDQAKDQSYMLGFLSQEMLSRTLMPLGDYDKKTVREIAGRLGLPVAEKKDSQEICFIPDNDHASFLVRNFGEEIRGAGDFAGPDGQLYGPHEGIIRYTIGQRKGLGLAFGHPVYVTGISGKDRRVIIGENEDLFHRTVRLSQINWMGGTGLNAPVSAQAKIRYRHPASPCLVSEGPDGSVTISFMSPVRAATPGQTAVVYKDGRILLAGIIDGVCDSDTVTS